MGATQIPRVAVIAEAHIPAHEQTGNTHLSLPRMFSCPPKHLTSCHTIWYYVARYRTRSMNDSGRDTCITQVSWLVANQEKAVQRPPVSLCSAYRPLHENRGLHCAVRAIGVYDTLTGVSKAPQNAIRSISNVFQAMLIDPSPSIFMSIVPCHTGIVNSVVDAGGSEAIV